MNTPLIRGRRFNFLGAAIAVSLSCLALLPLATASHAAECPPSKKEFAEAVNAAVGLLKQRKAADALAKLKETDAMQTVACEKAMVDKLKLAAAIGTGNAAMSAKSFDAVSSTIPPAEAAQYIMQISYFYLNDRDYANALSWVNRYISSGGPEMTRAKQILVAVYQGTGDYASLQKITLEQIAQTEKEGRTPSQDDLGIVLFTSDKLKDAQRHSAVVEKLVTYYPTAEHWDNAIRDLTGRPTFAHSRLQLDVLRLQYATGNMTKADQYVDYIELAIQAGALMEAKGVLEKGFETKVLGTGPEAARHGRLRDLILTKLEEAQKVQMYFAELDAKRAKAGDPWVDVGMTYYGLGKYDLSITSIEQGIAKGGLKNADDTRLHEALVYVAAGQKAKALDTFKLVKSTDGGADLARLWALKLGRS